MNQKLLDAKLKLAICGKCLGCNKLEDKAFSGVKQCERFRKG